ncbi:uncharacterized protein LOC131072618 isoform X2 [Cryptomeria japonica]|uniref:uncharacterized protein LOC131072618 isoform X2 n=1 Tax=Cryptomeria japonica TaxID=3369 RepID=UPI0027DA6E67|nr:uncharacterized protein LOC131072618 isoform X2 [Cryptomeria japonica]
MVPAMAVRLRISHSALYSSSVPPAGLLTLHFKTTNNCHGNCLGFNNGKLIFGAALQSLMVVRCASTLAQPGKNSHAVSEIPNEYGRLSSPTDQHWNPITATRDKDGRFRSPRAARELALLILYEACVEGSGPLRLLERRMNMRNDWAVQFDKTSLEYYDHMHFSGSPIVVETKEQARVYEMKQEEETSKEADVLAAPLNLVYNKFVLSMTRNILEAVVERWDQQVTILNEIIPNRWKAVDLAKRFCDGAAPRIINGCLTSFIEKENLRRKVPSQNQEDP